MSARFFFESTRLSGSGEQCRNNAFSVLPDQSYGTPRQPKRAVYIRPHKSFSRIFLTLINAAAGNPEFLSLDDKTNPMRTLIAFLFISGCVSLQAQSDTAGRGGIKVTRVETKTEKEKSREQAEAEKRAKQQEGLEKSRQEDEAAMKEEYEKEGARFREKARKQEEAEEKKRQRKAAKKQKRAAKDMEKGNSDHSVPKPLGG
jgi:hypothetical protein